MGNQPVAWPLITQENTTEKRRYTPSPRVTVDSGRLRTQHVGLLLNLF
jgi:hypothetical protein